MPIFNAADADSYDVPDEAPDAGFDWATAPDQLANEDSRNVEYEQYLIDAENSGIGGSLLDNLKKAWSIGGKAVDGIAAFAKSNPGLTSMLTSGVSTALSNKQRQELAEQQNQYKIDAEGRAKADAKELWDRRNQSIIAAQPANLGILGSTMYDKHVDYLKNRNKA